MGLRIQWSVKVECWMEDSILGMWHMFAICNPQPNWMPRKPKLMFQICQKVRGGLSMDFPADDVSAANSSRSILSSDRKA